VALERGSSLACLVVWIDILRTDGPDAAARAAQGLQGDQVCHFYDPRRRIGKAFAPSLGAGGALVWDVYLLFPAGRRWEEAPPPPAEWAHQLDAPWAEPSRFHVEDDLDDWLRRLTATSTQQR